MGFRPEAPGPARLASADLFPNDRRARSGVPKRFRPRSVAEAIRRNVSEKWEGREINTARFVKPARTMHAIGG